MVELFKNYDKDILSWLPIELCQIKAKISNNEVVKHNKIKIIEKSGEMLKQKEVLINAKGVVNGLREKDDGIVFFGKDKTKNDVLLTLSDDCEEEQSFVIYYRRDFECYFFKVINKNSDCFIKIDNIVTF